MQYMQRERAIPRQVVFTNGRVDKVLFDGGYCTFDGSQPQFHYYIKDHLGSNRIVMAENGQVEQKNCYYPFGGVYGDVSTNTDLQPYKYNGKELERYVIPNETNRYSLIIQDGFFSVLLQYCTGHEESFSETMKKICNNDPRHDEYWHSYDKDYIYDWKGMLERLGYK